MWYENDRLDCFIINDTTRDSAPVNVVSITITKADGTALASPFRIGIRTTGHDHKQHLKAVVNPSGEAANVTITVSDRLVKSNQQISNGTITFDVDGQGPSENKGDASITATHSSGPTVTKTVTVVIPSKIATPHDTTGGGVVVENLCRGSNHGDFQ